MDIRTIGVIKRRILGAFLAVLTLILGALATVPPYVAWRLDAATGTAAEAGLRLAVQRTTLALESTARDYAWWDELVEQFKAGIEPDWAARNLTIDMLGHFGVDGVFILDAGGRVVWSSIGGTLDAALDRGRFQADIAPHIGAARASASLEKPGSASGLVRMTGHLHALAVAQMTSNSGTVTMREDERGFIVLVRPFDRALLDEMAGMTQVRDLRFMDLAQRQKAPALNLEGAGGRPLGALTWEPSPAADRLFNDLIQAAGVALVFLIVISALFFRGQIRLFSLLDISLKNMAKSERDLAEKVAELERQTRESDLAKAVAERANETKSAFLATISHEMRTPLNGILGIAQVLKGTQLTPQQRDFVEMISSSGEWVLEVFSDVLDLSRAEAGRITLVRSDFELRPLVEGIVRFLQPNASRKSIIVSLEYGVDLPNVMHGDAGRLRQILINLMGNAVKFTDSGGVTLSVKRMPTPGPGIRVVFAVSDTGHGIPQDTLKRLFQPFVQAENTLARNPGGAGLGLSICRSLVSAMGGTIAVDSEVGVGSTFRVVLDLGAAQGPAEQQPPAHPNEPGRSLKVLLAEDNEVNQVVAKMLLERQGHEVVVVTDGGDAVAAVAKDDFDVVLMDIRMDKMDGTEATRHIRVLPDAKRAAVPIVAMTANLLAAERKTYAAAGMSGYLHKPFRSEDLAKVLAEMCGGAAPSVAEARPAESPAAVQTAPLPLIEISVIDRLTTDLGLDHAIRLAGLFEAKAESLVADVAVHLAQGDGDKAARAAHTLVSSAGNVGLVALSALARDIERAAQAGQAGQADAAALAAALPELHRQSLRALKDGLAAAREPA